MLVSWLNPPYINSLLESLFQQIRSLQNFTVFYKGFSKTVKLEAKIARERKAAADLISVSAFVCLLNFLIRSI